MPTVSIITAAYAPSSDFIADTIAGVAAQQLPDGWELEWIVQEDGAEPVLAERFKEAPNVRYAANKRQLGVAQTRNLALERASGSLIRVLDSDDVLLPDAISSLIPYFADTSIHWAVGQADDLMTDGQRVSWEPLIPIGKVRAGAVNDYALQNQGNWPIHCAGLILRADTVRAFGGWAGTPNDEDVVMFAALAELCDGYNEPSVSWLYRQHPGQVTRTDSWREQSAVGRHIALQRVAAIRVLGLTVGRPADSSALASTQKTRYEVGKAIKDRPAGEYL